VIEALLTARDRATCQVPQKPPADLEASQHMITQVAVLPLEAIPGKT
jgi:hypothetical protein